MTEPEVGLGISQGGAHEAQQHQDPVGGGAVSTHDNGSDSGGIGQASAEAHSEAMHSAEDLHHHYNGTDDVIIVNDHGSIHDACHHYHIKHDHYDNVFNNDGSAYYDSSNHKHYNSEQ